MSEILIGFFDNPVDESSLNQLSCTTNRIGGNAIWPYEPSKDLYNIINCPNCSQQRILLLQFNAPLDDKFNRIFYVFACLNHNCQQYDECWLCIRVQVLCDNQELNESKPFKKGTKKTIENLPSYFIFVEEGIEPENEKLKLSIPTMENEKLAYEEYEKNDLNFDKATYTFIKTIRKQPGQAIRYCRKNEAMLPFNNFEKPEKKCSNCGSRLIFEFQLISSMFSELFKNVQNEPLFNFNTLLVFTCEKSCWRPKQMYVQEATFVQFEHPDDFSF